MQKKKLQKTTKMTTSQQISNFLGFTPQQYNQVYTDRYLRWCEAYSKELDIHLQKLLSNTAISLWYSEHFAELEYQAYQILLPCHAFITKQKAYEMYNIVVKDIFLNYPKPLFDAANKITIINTLN